MERHILAALLVIGLGGLTLAGFDAGAQTTQDEAAAWPEADAAAGKRKAGMCRTCHGADGVAAIPIAPHIGGEPFGYLAAQLAAFRSGARTHEMMSVVTKGLSDQDIADVAAYFAGFTPIVAPPEGRSEDDAPALCASCHGVDGIAVFPDAPNLAGETEIYIATQLKAFKFGKRENDVMSPIAADLTEDEIRAYAKWYAEIKFETKAAE